MLRSLSFSLATLSRSRRLASRSALVSRRCSGWAACCVLGAPEELKPGRRLKSARLARFRDREEEDTCGVRLRLGSPALDGDLAVEPPCSPVCFELLLPIAAQAGPFSTDGDDRAGKCALRERVCRFNGIARGVPVSDVEEEIVRLVTKVRATRLRDR